MGSGAEDNVIPQHAEIDGDRCGSPRRHEQEPSNAPGGEIAAALAGIKLGQNGARRRRCLPRWLAEARAAQGGDRSGQRIGEAGQRVPTGLRSRTGFEILQVIGSHPRSGRGFLAAQADAFPLVRDTPAQVTGRLIAAIPHLAFLSS
jgi:hypothetical protein